MQLWEVGVLLIGIGILILCIFLGTTLRDLGSTIKRVNSILTENQSEIRTIIVNVAYTTDTINKVTTNAEKVMKAVTTFGALRGVTSGFKKGRKV